MAITLIANPGATSQAPASGSERSTARGRTGKASAALWTTQGLVTAIFLFAGVSKVLIPLDMLAQLSPLPALLLKFIGAAEVTGAVGLILPGLLHIRPGLTPIAAGCLSMIVACATAITLAGGDVIGAVLPLVTLLLSLFIVYGRSRLTPGAASTPC